MANHATITRRAALSSLSLAPLAMALPATAAVALPYNAAEASQIETLFREWEALQSQDWNALTFAGREDDCLRYACLKREIAAIVPVTARDLAMQFLCTIDLGDSDYPDDFLKSAQALAA